MKYWPLITQIIDFVLLIVEKIIKERQERKDLTLQKQALKTLAQEKINATKKNV